MTGYVIHAANLVISGSPAAAPGLTVQAGFTEPDTMAMSAREVAQLNLFGQLRQPAAVNPARFAQAPKTKLDLTLNAVFANTEPPLASAVIATDNNSLAKRYFLGEALPGQAVLYAIHPEYVVLERGGRLEKLVFPRDRSE